MPTSTVEDYLKCIYLEQDAAPGQDVSTGQIAAGLQVAPGTATAMVKTLRDSGLVHYEPYSGVRLTDAGRQLATHVLRRHRLVELFLVKIMGLNWSEVHSEAEVLEHVISERILERMDQMLGHPSADPHGDPIPSAGGEIANPPYQNLLECELEETQVLARVTDQRQDFLRLLEKHGLMPGRRLVVSGRDTLSETVRILPAEGEPLQLGYRAASKVLVESS